MIPETHFLGKVAQKAIIEKDGKVLIVRDVRDVSVWGLPGGRLNVDETPFEGLQREVKEEVGVAISIHELIYGEQFVHPQKNDPHLFLMYHAQLLGENQNIALQEDEIAEVKWISKEELNAQELYPMYRRALEAYFAR